MKKSPKELLSSVEQIASTIKNNAGELDSKPCIACDYEIWGYCIKCDKKIVQIEVSDCNDYEDFQTKMEVK